MKKNIFIVAILTFLLYSCDDSLYNKTKDIPSMHWNMNNIVKFDVEVSDTFQLYDFYVIIRHNTDYAYSNLYTFVTTTMPNDSITRDTIEFILAQPDGKWIGKGNGFLRTNEVLISRKFAFPHKGLYTFEFQQAMRDTDLVGISDIGIRVSPTNL
jgi:gliding motility-associated lipoprotein GldH